MISDRIEGELKRCQSALIISCKRRSMSPPQLSTLPRHSGSRKPPKITARKPDRWNVWLYASSFYLPLETLSARSTT